MQSNGQPLAGDLPPMLRQALMACALCNNSSLRKDPDTQAWIATGDPTEVRMLTHIRTHTLAQAAGFLSPMLRLAFIACARSE